MATQDLDSVIALIAGTSPEDVEKQLLPVFKKLDKQAEQASTRSASAAAATSRSRGAAGPSSSSAAAPSTSAQQPPLPPAHLLQGKLANGQDPLDVLSPYQHSVGYLYILLARLQGSVAGLETTLQKAQGFVQQFDRDELSEWGEIVFLFANLVLGIAEASPQATLPLEILSTLLQRFPQPGYLTPLHPQFLQLVLSSGQYASALPLLLDDITDVDKNLYPVKYQDHLLYHYLGGVILALLSEYGRAADFLEIAVSAPGSHASMIQVDAFKKMVLVQLLAYGKVQPLPKYTSQPVQQAIKALCPAYTEYAVAFTSLDAAKVGQIRDKAREVFEKDLNIGLIQLCDNSLRRRQIQKITETYITQSLGDLTVAVGMDPSDERHVEEVEQEVRGMIATRQIFASLSPPTTSTSRANTTVTFTDDPEPYLSHATVEKVTRAIKAAQELEKRWEAEGRKVGESKEFVQKAWTTAANGPSASGGGGLGNFAGGFSDDFDYAGGGTPGGVPGGWGGMGDEIDLDSD